MGTETRIIKNKSRLKMKPLVISLMVLLFGCSSVDDLSKQKPFSDLIGKELRIQRPCRLIKCSSGHRFKSYILHEKSEFDCQIVEEIAPGMSFIINSFKVYDNGESGSKSIYAIGEIHSASLDRSIAFEYLWGFNARPLPSAVWDVDSLVADRKIIVP